MGIGPLTPRDIRQFSREYQERADDVRSLIEDLQDTGRETDDLESILNRLEALERQPIYDDPAELERLQTSVLQDMKRFEFGLRRDLNRNDPERLFLSGNEEVPSVFRKLVEEYYRSLARRSSRTIPPDRN